MSGIHKQEYRLLDLPTRTVTLFPSRAQVIRDIKNVALKAGINQVSITGLTPTVDEHSIKIEGTGSAVITDISVQLLPNQDIFEDIFPMPEDGKKSRQDDQQDEKIQDPPCVTKLNEETNQLNIKLVALEDDLKRASEVIANADRRLKMLDEYGAKFEPKSGADISGILETYHTQRSHIFQDHMNGTVRERELRKQLSTLRSTLLRLEGEIRNERTKANSAQVEAEEAKARKTALEHKRMAKKVGENARLRREREKFWPKSCYTACITLDANSYAPTSSRRSSVSGVSALASPSLEKQQLRGLSSLDTEPVEIICDLSISYVTASASWSPCYDLQLDTTSTTAMLLFDAQLTNLTSESWKDCKIILSTSQAVYAGLQDAIPRLVPWTIKLVSKGVVNQGDITNSLEERQALVKPLHDSINHCANPITRAALFGVSSETHQQPKDVRPQNKAVGATLFGAAAARAPASSVGGGLFGVPMAQMSTSSCQAGTSPFGALAVGGGGGGGGLFGQQPDSRTARVNPFHPEPLSTAANDSQEQGEEETLREPQLSAELAFQESEIEETGLTTTYDLPGTKSLVPSSTASKQRVAHITLTNVTFSHTVVAKYRAAAFLKTKLRNTSKITLLKGPVGLTLDGTFMGRSTLPHCSSGSTFALNLGVDPAIRVSYAKPDVKRSTSGVFTKENSTTYARSITISNTRVAAGGRSVRLVVLDQVPVSEDEKLRVELVHPRGLVAGGAEAATGVPDSNARDGTDWGKAVATMKKNGQVSWDVLLGAGKGVKLALEYDVSLPAGSHAVQVSEGGH